MVPQNEDLIRHFLSLWSVRDAEGMAVCFAEDGVYDNVPDNQPIVGRDAIRQWLEGVFAMLTRIDVEILNMVSNGELVLHERIDDHVDGDRHMRLPVMNSCRIVDGRIVLFRDYYDYDTVRRLGIV